MNDFQKALLQSVNNEFAYVPAEQEIDIPALAPKRKRRHTLRRSLLIAAAVLILVGSVFAAYALKHPIGEVDVKTDEVEIFGFELSEEDNNLYYQLTFSELSVNPDAPQKLEAYFLPQKFVDAQSVNGWDCFIEDHDSMLIYYMFREEQPLDRVLTQEEIDLVHSNADGVHYSWYSEEYGFIYFWQTRAIEAADGTPFVNHAVPDSEEQHATYRTIEIDEYSIFSFEVSFDFDEDISRTWYWTDGDYIFSLSACLSEAEMTEMLRSVTAVSTVFPYKRIWSYGFEAQYEELFDLLP